MENEFFCFSEKGDRKVNEDYVIIDNRKGIYIISDGVAGGPNGKQCSMIASTLAFYSLSEIQALLARKDYTPEMQRKMIAEPCRYANQVVNSLEIDSAPHFTIEVDHDAIKAMVRHANDSVTRCSQEVPDMRNAGATLDACLLHQDKAYISHVGDSSVFLVKAETGEIEKVTTDHHVASVYEKGNYPPDEFNVLGARLALSSCIGCGDRIMIDVEERNIFPGDAILMATDGLTNVVTLEEIKKAVLGKREDAVQALADYAKKSEGMKKAYKNLALKGIEITPIKPFSDNTSFIVIYKGD